MKCKLFPLVNKYTLKKLNVNKYPWGWISQKSVKKIIVKNKPQFLTNGFDNNINKKINIDVNSFEKGALQGYKTIYKYFTDRKNFLHVNYTTPHLSNAINHINRFSKKSDKILLDDLEAKIMFNWVEVGNASTNNFLFGMIDMDLVKTEIGKSSVSDMWDIYVGPLRQKVRVVYKTNERYDVWEWQRCLMKENDEWTVSNINEILK